MCLCSSATQTLPSSTTTNQGLIHLYVIFKPPAHQQHQQHSDQPACEKSTHGNGDGRRIGAAYMFKHIHIMADISSRHACRHLKEGQKTKSIFRHIDLLTVVAFPAAALPIPSTRSTERSTLALLNVERRIDWCSLCCGDAVGIRGWQGSRKA